MQKIGPNGDGKSAVATPNGISQKKRMIYIIYMYVHTHVVVVA